MLQIEACTEPTDDLRDLVAEYEASLPGDLRHGSLEPFEVAFVARLDGVPAGCVALERHEPSRAILKRLFVRPGFRKHGVARALIDALIERARADGYGRVALDTNRERLEPAYRLYRALGFREVDPYAEVSYRCPTFMELTL